MTQPTSICRENSIDTGSFRTSHEFIHNGHMLSLPALHWPVHAMRLQHNCFFFNRVPNTPLPDCRQALADRLRIFALRSASHRRTVFWTHGEDWNKRETNRSDCHDVSLDLGGASGHGFGKCRMHRGSGLPSSPSTREDERDEENAYLPRPDATGLVRACYRCHKTRLHHSRRRSRNSPLAPLI